MDNSIDLNRLVFIDEMTGMKNFFCFLNSDAGRLFGDEGVAAVLDMIGFKAWNESFGRETGNLCIKTLSYIIEGIPCRHTAFRTCGDEFIIIFPKAKKADIAQIIAQLEDNYLKELEKLKIPTNGVRNILIEYKNPIKSVSEFYILLITESVQSGICENTDCPKHNTVVRILSDILNKTQEALGLLDYNLNMSFTDDVSGLQNSRAARMHLESLLSERGTDKKPFAVLFIDGDNLKRYNDISYEAGNEMIKSLGATLKGALRSDDKIFRWLSGDEFLIILHDLDCGLALKIAERIRGAAEAKCDKSEIPVTVSIGVACYPGDGTTAESLIDLAEISNRTAKEMGKNRVSAANGMVIARERR